MRESSDFRTSMRRGTRSGNSLLVVHLANLGETDAPAAHTAGDPPAAEALVGFAVSKSVGNAVTRNRVKRRLRHLVASRIERLDARSRMVVRALPASAHASGEELAAALKDAWGRSERRLRGQRGRSGDGATAATGPTGRKANG